MRHRRSRLMRLNKIQCTGKIISKSTPCWKVKKLEFFNNTLSLTNQNFNLYVVNNIRVLFLNNIYRQLFPVIERAFSCGITSLDCRVVNIHYSTCVNYDSKTIRSHFLPNLLHHFDVKKTEVTQEPSASHPVNLKKFMQSEGAFITITLRGEGATLKFQTDQTKQRMNCTLILSNFSRKNRELLNFLEKEEHHEF